MKKILLAICILTVAIVFVLPLLLPKTFNSKVSLEIQVPVEVVFDRVAICTAGRTGAPGMLRSPLQNLKPQEPQGLLAVSWNGKVKKLAKGAKSCALLKITSPYAFNWILLSPRRPLPRATGSLKTPEMAAQS